MTATERVIRWSTAGMVVGIAAVAAVASYELVRVHGESGWTARPVPLTVDGLIYASSMAMLDSARQKVQVAALARWLLGLGIAATLAANVAHGLGHGLAGAAVAACPAVALARSYELLMLIIRNVQAQPDAALAPGCLTIHSRCRPRRSSPGTSPPVAFLRCGLSGRGFISASRVRRGYRRTWPLSPVDRILARFQTGCKAASGAGWRRRPGNV
jgi:hypothetical protein